MKERKSYQGTLNGISGIWCDQKPEGLELAKEITFYTPDEGMVFIRGGNFYDSVVITEGVDIKDFQEVKDPRSQENEHMPKTPAEEVSE